jgi:hypothetical protein
LIYGPLYSDRDITRKSACARKVTRYQINGENLV